MALLDDLLGSVASITGPKQTEVAQTTQTKQQEMSAPSIDFAQNALMARTGEGMASATELQRDAATMRPFELQEKYGYDEGSRILREANAGTIADFRLSTPQRTDAEALRDGILSLGNAAVSGFTGLAALSADIDGQVFQRLGRPFGVELPNPGPYVAQAGQALSDGILSLQSPAMQARRQMSEAEGALVRRDSEAMYPDNPAASFIDDAITTGQREFRNLTRSVGRTITDPTMLADGTASAVGSLLGGAVIGKGIRAGAAGLGAIGRRLLERASMPLAIGLQEGGSAYQQNAAELMNMSHEDLVQRSPDYARMIMEGMTTDQAKNALASDAGLLAAAIQGPASAAAGVLVSKFERNPFAVGSLRAAGANAIKEAVEEGIQGATGQVAQNYGIQQTGDMNRRLSEGVGEQIGQGALFGSMAAGVTQAPGAAGRAALNAGMGAGRVVLSGVAGLAQAAGNDLNAAYEHLVKRNEAASPVSDERMQQNVEATVATAPDAVAAMQAEVEASDATPEEKAVSISRLGEMATFNEVDPAEAQDLSLMGRVREAIAGANGSRIDAMRNVANLVVESTADARDRLSAAAALVGMAGKFEAQQFAENVALPAGSALQKGFQQIASVMGNMANTPTIQKGLKQAREFLVQAAENGQITPVTAENVQTEEGQQNARNAAALASVAPDKLNPEIAKAVLFHSEKGTIKLTPEQKRALSVSVAMVEAARAYTRQQEALGLKSNADVVNAQLMSREWKKDSGVQSMVGFSMGVKSALEAGNTALAQQLLTTFSKMAQHMQNKVAAYNESMLRNGEKVTYQSLRQTDRTFVPAPVGVYTNTKSSNSIQMAQQVALEAEAYLAAYNGFRQAFPELAGPEILPQKLDASLMGPVQEVMKNFREKGIPARTKEVEAPVVRQAEPVVETAPVQEEALAPVVEQPSVSPTIDNTPSVSETVEPDTQEVEAPKREPFLNLIKTAGKTLFTAGFRQRDNTNLNVDSPYAVIREAIRSAPVNDDIKGGYVEVAKQAGRIGRALDASLEAFLKNKIKGTDIEKGTRWRNGKAANITEVVDGKVQWNQQLKEAAILAGLQWALVAQSQAPILDKGDVAALLGIPESEVTPGQEERFKRSITLVAATSALSAKIMQYWGVSPNRTAPMGLNQGIADAVAKEILQKMIETGAVSMETRKFTANGIEITDKAPGTTAKTIYFIRPTMTQEGDPIRAYPDLIDRAALPEADRSPGVYFGDEKPQVAKTQMNNPLVENTSANRRMIRREQETEFKINTVMHQLYSALGSGGMVQFLTGGQYDPNDKNLNPAHLKTVEGKYQAIVEAFANTMDVANAAALRGPMGEQILRYAYNVSKVGRLQMLGRYSPQASKLAREMILPTWSTLDLTDPEGPHYRAFMLAMGQALGVKVHTMSFDRMHEELMGKLAAAQPAVDMLSGVQGGNALKDGDALVLRQMVEAAKIPTSEAALHALTEYARYLNSKTDLSNFTTALYLEADGVTNGPINAMNMITTGAFTADWVRNVAKGGRSFVAGQSLNDFREGIRGTEEAPDLYGQTSTTLTNLLRDVRQGFIERRNPSLQNLDSITNLMVQFLGKDVSLNADGSLTFDRGMAKNPLTITIYGSGARGIAGNVADQLMSAVYEQMSDAAVRMAEDNISMAEAMFPGMSKQDAQIKFNSFTKSLNRLIEFAPRRVENRVSLTETGVKTPIYTPAEFVLNPAQYTALVDNINQFYVRSLVKAIDSTVGQGLRESSTQLRIGTQLPSIFAKHYFNQLVREAVADQQDGMTADFLSQEKLEEIQREVMSKFGPVDTGDQIFALGSSQSTDSNLTKGWAETLDGQMNTQAFIRGPSNAGVAGIPSMIIGMGDGLMMQLISGVQSVTGSLKIFDGMNMKLTSIMEDSLVANEAVAQTWAGNPLRQVSDNFNASMRYMGLKDASPEMIQELSDALYGKRPEGSAPVPVVQLLADIEQFRRSLQNAAFSVDIRNEVLAEVGQSIDQMASAAAPFQTKGEFLTDTTPEGIAAELTRRYNEKMQERAGQLQKEETIVPKKAARTKKPTTVESLGKSHPSGVRVWGSSTILRAADLLGVDKLQGAILRDIQRFLAQKEYTVVYGSVEQLQAYAEQTGKIGLTQNQIDEAGTIRGYTSLGDQTIYLVNPSAETLVHELIHAYTFETVANHYFGESTPEVAAAVGRIEKLMQQFLSMNPDFSQMSAPYRRSFDNARNAIEGFSDTPIGKASALNEFMAWGLTNKEVAQTLSNTRSLVQMARDVFQQIKALIWGRKRVAQPGEDVFSNLLFNSSIIVMSRPTVQQTANEGTLFQSEAYGNDERLTQVNQTFQSRITDMQDSRTVENAADRNAQLTAGQLAADSIIKAISHTFPMNMQQSSTFKLIATALATEAEIDASSMIQAQKLYAHVIENLTPQSFMENPESTDPNELALAKAKYDVIVGNRVSSTDKLGRSSLVPIFLALATVSDEFRDVLAKIDLPKGERSPWNTMDGILENIGSIAMEKLSERLAGGPPTNPSVKAAVDGLNARIAQVAYDRQSWIATAAQGMSDAVNTVNDYAVTGLQVAAEAAGRLADKVETPSSLANLAATATKFVADSIADPAAFNTGMARVVNRMSAVRPVQELVSSVLGRNASNFRIYDNVKLFRSFVQRVRQQYREQLPTKMAREFTSSPSKAEWTGVFHMVGKTDIAALTDYFDTNDIISFMQDPAKFADGLKSLENTLGNMDPQHSKLLIQKSKQLANFMVTGRPGPNLLRNADAIANLLNEKITADREVTDNMVSLIEQLTTFYALQQSNPAQRQAMARLFKDETAGLSYVINYMRGQRVIEKEKAAEGGAKFNYYKGYIPSTPQDGLTLFVANDKEAAKLAEMSFHNIGRYNGSIVDSRKDSHSYYFLEANGRSAFSQGSIQTVRQTAGGVDTATGFTMDLTAGRITDPDIVGVLAGRLNREDPDSTENLMPVFDGDGNVIALERSVDPTIRAKLNHDTNFAKMMGVWKGRQSEEAAAEVMNRKLIDDIHATWVSEIQKGASNQKGFVNILDDSDPVTADAAKLFPYTLLKYAEQKFGKEGVIWVPRDMLQNVTGAREASVGDAWTGNSRWSKDKQDLFKKLSMRFMGNAAYRRLVNIEQGTQTVVQDIKVLVVVKSVAVPAANFVSNMKQLLIRGVAPNVMLRDLPKKIQEADTFTKNEIRRGELEADLQASTDVIKARKIEAELQALADANKRLSIWPLIQAGEFTAISDAGISRDEILLTEGRLQEYIEKMASRMPGRLREFGRYALVAKNTALFQGLQKATDYGDFVAKAVYFDHLTKEKKLNQKDALAKITEEYVNYDLQGGRFRTYLEKMGLLWFPTYKIQSIKTAASILRNNPAQALIGNLMPVPEFIASAGGPLSDNGLTKMADGSILYSMGPGQGFHALALNPMVQILR